MNRIAEDNTYRDDVRSNLTVTTDTAKEYLRKEVTSTQKITPEYLKGLRGGTKGRNIIYCLLVVSDYNTTHELLDRFEGFTVGELLTLDI